MAVLNYVYGGFLAVVEYSITQDVSKNQSTITIDRIGFSTTGTSLSTSRAEGWLKIGGERAAYWNYYDGNTMTTVILNNGYFDYIEKATAYHSNSVTIDHNADGSCNVSFELYWTLKSYSMQTLWMAATQSQMVELPVTVRDTAPMIDVGASEGSPVVLGSVMKITLNANATSLLHTLLCRVNGEDRVIGSEIPGGVTEWEVPYSLAAVYPTRVDGVGEILCRTYLNGEQIGQDRQVGFWFRVPDNDVTKPKITGFSLQPVATEIPGKFAGLYIRNVTQIRGDITAEGTYSPVREYRLVGNGISSEGGMQGTVYGQSNVSGPVTVIGRVTDQRGFSRDLGMDIYVYAYDTPSVAPVDGNTVECTRSDGDGVPSDTGAHLKISARKVCSSIAVDGEELNSCRMEYRYKEAAAEAFGGWTALPDMETVRYVSKEMILDIKHSYHVQIRAIDDVGRDGSVTIAISSDSVTLHLKRGGKGAAFFKRAEREGALEIAGDVLVEGNLVIGGKKITGSQLEALLALLT